MSVPKPIGDKNILDRRVPRNPKYSEVDAVVDTGFNMRKLEATVGPHMNTRFRKEEHFKRIKVSTLGRMLQETEKGVEILLLDLRPVDEFEKCHIQAAKPYPAAIFRRASNNITPELMMAMNKEKHIVVIHDEDEKDAVEIGEYLYERDVNNVYVLSGGLLEFAGMFAELLSAPLPEELAEKQKAKLLASPSSRASVRSSRRGAGSSRMSTSGLTANVVAPRRQSSGMRPGAVAAAGPKQ